MLARILYCIVGKFDGGLNLMNIRQIKSININIFASTKFVI